LLRLPTKTAAHTPDRSGRESCPAGGDCSHAETAGTAHTCGGSRRHDAAALHGPHNPCRAGPASPTERAPAHLARCLVPRQPRPSSKVEPRSLPQRGTAAASAVERTAARCVQRNPGGLQREAGKPLAALVPAWAGAQPGSQQAW
jgi:hypothetical protein